MSFVWFLPWLACRLEIEAPADDTSTDPAEPTYETGMPRPPMTGDTGVPR